MSNWMSRFWSWLRGKPLVPYEDLRVLEAAADEVTDVVMVEAPLPEPPPPELMAVAVGTHPQQRLALMTVSGSLRDAMVAQYREQWATSGSLVGNGGKVAPSTILSVVGAAGGSVGVSTAMSGQLFIATANPATLMAIGNGVGSAVVGSAGGIVAQAPFIAASSAIIPVVAPLIAFQAISTFMTMKQFAKIRQDLARVERALERVLHRTEATFASELVALSQRLESLEDQFSDERQFSTDMIVRLALVEERVGALCERYKLLNGAQEVSGDASETDFDFKTHDSRLAVIASSMTLRVGYLRLALSLQDSPSRTARLVEVFGTLCDEHERLLEEVKKDGELAREILEELNTAIAGMDWWQRTMPKPLLGSRSERIEAQKASAMLRHFNTRQDEVEKLEIADAQTLSTQARSALAGSDELALIYWQDEFGEHSYYVEKLPEGLPAELIGTGNEQEDSQAVTDRPGVTQLK